MPANSTKSKTKRSSGNRTGTRTSSRSSRSPSVRGRSGRTRRNTSTGILAGVLELFSLTYFGRVILVLLVAALLVLLNILLSRNSFDLFFRLAGVEMILTTVIVWLRFLLRKD